MTSTPTSRERQVKAAMTRRMNVMFATLKEAEWSAGNALYPECPVCGGNEPTHQLVPRGSKGKDSIDGPCPIQFALSEAAYVGYPTKVVTRRTFEDGSRFLELRP